MNILHSWEATGVTGYPITHPIVGQSDFYTKFKHYLQLVGTQENRFAHVFAVVAPWGVGKSRLGYEIVAQTNDASKGWKVRSATGGLEEARIFDSDAEREQYLALYLRYSQVAHSQLNLDNWFAPAVYKALLPLAHGEFDTSVQHQIAKQSVSRLNAEGFDPQQLAEALEIGQRSDEDIYRDTQLATRLCNAAFETLKRYGIRYLIVVLDELETAAERATGGMEAEEARTMDGKAITMLRRAVETLGRKEIETANAVKTLGRREIEAVSKAVKEEDARARFPWLRFVALCSPAIGDELKEVQSTDRRFEIADLSRNAFSDVSTFVKSLEADGRLLRPYPKGLVEAAYMMSGGNFGWFNVIMAVLDQVLSKQKAPIQLSAIFRRAIEISNRIGSYVLDHRALEELNGDAPSKEAAAELIFGQEPVALTPAVFPLLTMKNAHGEPVAIRYHRVEWTVAECGRVLIQNRFTRISGTSRWIAPGMSDPVDLERLIDDLATLAIHEDQPGGGHVRLLLPGNHGDFLQLLDLIHPHAGVEEVGRVLWAGLIGSGTLPEGEATHIGPSIEMLRRLNIRLRKASVGSVFRNAEESQAFSSFFEKYRPKEQERALHVLTGLYRLLDENWNYETEPSELKPGLVALRTPKDKGWIDFKGVSLHPKGLTMLGWADGDQQLLELITTIAPLRRSEGQFPVLIFTRDYDLPERFANSGQSVFVGARDYVMVAHVNSGEESALASIGLPASLCANFRLRRDGFTARFAERLNRIKTPLARQIHKWRHGLSLRGSIAWPLRPTGPLKDEVLKRLLKSWSIVMLEKGGVSLQEVGAAPGLDFSALTDDLSKLGLSPAAGPKGYTQEDTAGFWLGEGGTAHPEVPIFLLRVLLEQLYHHPLDLEYAQRNWLWGYVWDNARIKDIFQEWAVILCDLGWAFLDESNKKKSYRLLERAELRGQIQEARNWLDRGYPTTFQTIREILGHGQMDTHFKPGEGSKFAKAEDQLKLAEKALLSLEALEASPPTFDKEGALNWFVKATRLRLEIEAKVKQVFVKNDYEALSGDLELRSLNLLDDGQPLWRRIRQAEHFATAVRDLSRRIRRRIPSLIDDVRKEAPPGFPTNIFILPLTKLDHIVDAGLTGEDPLATTKRAQHAKVDTLAWFLKELRVADAMALMQKFANEIGIKEQASQDLSFEQIDGEIFSGFRDLKARYEAARSNLRSIDQRIHRVTFALENPPDNFRLPSGITLEMVAGVPIAIEPSLDALPDDAVLLLDHHDEEMTLGNFGPLMRVVRTRLLASVEDAIKLLEGRVRTLENAIQAWRQARLDDPKLLHTRVAFNLLLRAQKQAEVPAPNMPDLAELSLSEAATFLDGLCTEWAQLGAVCLSTTGVSFQTWEQAITAVQSGKEPPLNAAQADALVQKNFLRRVYALPGGTR